MNRIANGVADSSVVGASRERIVAATRRRGVSFVTWYPSCRRSDALAGRFAGRSHLIHYFEFKQPLYAPAKYLLQALVTWRRLWQDRPDVVFVASPPVFAAVAVRLYAACARIPFVVDAHTGIFDDPRWTWLAPVSRWLSRAAAATIVTNEALAARVRSWGARAVVIGDVPVTFPETPATDLGAGFHVAVVNTFSQDEPIEEVIAAARTLPGCRFHVTGNPRHARTRWQGELPANVRLTGWLSDEGYAGLLRGAQAVVCLTTHDLTMQRGAYEAVALEKPLITSNWPLLRETFYRGTVHVDNSAAAIAAAVRSVRGRAAALAEEMRLLRSERAGVFEAAAASLEPLIANERTRS